MPIIRTLLSSQGVSQEIFVIGVLFERQEIKILPITEKAFYLELNLWKAYDILPKVFLEKNPIWKRIVSELLT